MPRPIDLPGDAAGLMSAFHTWLDHVLADMRTAAHAINSADTREAALETLMTCAHNLKGTAASFGYAAIGAVGGQLFDYLRLCGGTGLKSGIVHAHVDTVEQMMDSTNAMDDRRLVATLQALTRAALDRGAAG